MVWEVAWLLLDQGKDATRNSGVMKQRIDNLVLNVAAMLCGVPGGYGYVNRLPGQIMVAQRAASHHL